MNAVRSTIRRNVRETLLSNDLSSIQSRPMETPLATNNHLNDDNEDVEFSDAFSEIPSASSVPKTESSEEWQSLVPNEWVLNFLINHFTFQNINHFLFRK